MKITVIFHSADYDGLFCREIARKFLPEAELIGWNFGDPPIPFPKEGMVYVLDLPMDTPFGFAFTNPVSVFETFGSVEGMKEANSRMVWIDHHKTAIDSHPKEIPGYRIDGVAACRLAWQWFTDPDAENYRGRAWTGGSKDNFLNRSVKEPLAVRLAGEYDIWDHRGDGDLEFQFGLRVEKEDLYWGELLDEDKDDFYVRKLIDIGRVAMKYSANVDAGMTKALAFLLKWEGLTFLALNTGRFNSQTFEAKDVSETGHEALLGFNWNGKRWTVSLYHASHRKDLDLSEIAKKYGGGGHRGACGFTATSLPFAL